MRCAGFGLISGLGNMDIRRLGTAERDFSVTVSVTFTGSDTGPFILCDMFSGSTFLQFSSSFIPTDVLLVLSCDCNKSLSLEICVSTHFSLESLLWEGTTLEHFLMKASLTTILLAEDNIAKELALLGEVLFEDILSLTSFITTGGRSSLEAIFDFIALASFPLQGSLFSQLLLVEFDRLNVGS